ncbi:DUF378 domain-containing protein [Amedibacillus sp. YH-ame10]
MKILNYIALIIGIVGALNWGLIGLFDINLVTMLFGVDTMLTRIVYVLVGISGLWMLTFFPRLNDTKY